MVGAQAPDRLDGAAPLPLHAGRELGQLRAHGADRRVGRVGELAVAARRVRPTGGAAAGIVHRRSTGRAPGVELRPVRGGAGDGVAVDRALQAVADRVLHAAAAAVLDVGVRAAAAACDTRERVAAVALLAPDAAPDGEPQAGLGGLARVALPVRDVRAGAWRLVRSPTPYVRGRAVRPLREEAVDRVARLGCVVHAAGELDTAPRMRVWAAWERAGDGLRKMRLECALAVARSTERAQSLISCGLRNPATPLANWLLRGVPAGRAASAALSPGVIDP